VSAAEPPLTKQPKLHTLSLKSLKRTYDVFISNVGAPITTDPESQKIKLSMRIMDEYKHVKDLPPPENLNRLNHKKLDPREQLRGKRLRH